MAEPRVPTRVRHRWSESSCGPGTVPLCGGDGAWAWRRSWNLNDLYFGPPTTQKSNGFQVNICYSCGVDFERINVKERDWKGREDREDMRSRRKIAS